SRGKVTFGYYRRRSDEITDIESCLVTDPLLFELRKKIKPLLNSVLFEESPADFFLQLVDGKVDLVITGEINEEAAKKLFIPPITRGKITKQFGSISVDLPSGSFLQPTLEGEKALVHAVSHALPGGKYADLFSGSGTFTGPLLSKGPVDAFESNLGSVKA